MARLMRCNTPYWAGNRFINAGTVLPEGDPLVVPIYFEPFEVTEPETGVSRGGAQTTSRRGRRKKADEENSEES